MTYLLNILYIRHVVIRLYCHTIYQLFLYEKSDYEESILKDLKYFEKI